MWSHKFRDGVIEVTGGDAYGGPGNCFSKLNVNTTANFVRKNGGRWHRADQRSEHKLRKLIESCEAADEVMHTLCFVEREQPK